MPKILVIGKNSYIGNSFEKWMFNRKKIKIDKIGSRNSEWESISFKEYDVVIHSAAIVHKKETKKNIQLYYKINRDLSYTIAKKSKKEGVKQFIFLSSMSIYGLDEGTINKNTLERPKTAYGKSKLEAEQLIKKLEDDNFIVAILRPPMVYGENCKGNYSFLSKITQKIKFFPNIPNQRSMIYIDNLSYYIFNIITNKVSGTFFPQNKEYVSTVDMIKNIAEINDHKVIFISIFNFLFDTLNISITNKIFGDLVYDMELMDNINGIADPKKLISFKDSIIFSEKGKLTK